MADERLSVELKAEIEGFGRDLNKALGLVENFDSKASSASNSVSKSLAKTAEASAKTGTSFQGLSRVMSDFAFGPAAIANNLEGLANDFKQLQTASKETGESLGKTLVQSLAGSGGVNLALGAFTLAMSVASVGMSAWTRLFPEAKTKAEDYAKTLDDLTKAHLTGSQNAAQELVQLRLLYSATQNASLSVAERKKAVDELQKQYPSYFGNLKDENILAGKAESAYKNLTEAIIAASRARAAQDIMVTNQKRQLENEQKLTDLKAEQIKLQNEYDKIRAQATQPGVGTGVAGYASMMAGLEKQIADNIREQNNLKTDSNILNGRNLQLVKSINAEVAKNGTGVLTGLGGGGTGVGSNKTFSRDSHVDLVNDLGTKDFWREMAKNSQDFSKVVNLNESLIKPFKEASPQLLDFANEMIKASEKLNQEFQANLAGLGQGITDSLGGAVGAMLTGKNAMDAFGQGFLHSFGSFLGKFGDQLIAFGIAAKAFTVLKKALANPLTGELSLGAAIGVIAAGVALKGMAAAISSNIGGGGTGGGNTDALVVTRGGNYSPQQYSYPSGNVATPTNRRTAETIVVGGNIRFDAGQMYLELEREGNKMVRRR